ncbi:MAG TPA: tRNA preQ1(34) S-adenosylmethionine ribosyltransferase-isomerase QueA [Desulfomonilia bacterium]|nr:tRNA preQ1(34) S-adenosylmethionine ribosyltransferase-isomerase QueA [Desulfomonilia bacterium]
MKTNQFFYHLPKQLVAQYPLERGKERLLVVERDTGKIHHGQFAELLSYLQRGDVLVMNDTKVIPARLIGRKETGGVVEVLLIRQMGGSRWQCLVSASKPAKTGVVITFSDNLEARVEKREGNDYLLNFSDAQRVLKTGKVPLPPYIDREPEDLDLSAYQTVYARNEGSVASPTAGLHFTRDMLGRIESLGITIIYLTLHVGPGTFTPVRTEFVEEHTMHAEEFTLSEPSARAIHEAMRKGKRIVAVGTTSTRVLEHMMRLHGKIIPGRGYTDLFIYNGFDFKVIGALLTNFHLPCSTLLMLVSSFGGHDHIMNAYREAVERKYRFFSYGDAMLII